MNQKNKFFYLKYLSILPYANQKIFDTFTGIFRLAVKRTSKAPPRTAEKMLPHPL
jgi:hypothetical protein